MDKYICIHGHFYQPPRENPWLETIELQESAYPYHDWNERINAECYQPNTASRIFDGQGSIERIVNNDAHISFNFGPTLLAWLETYANDTYDAILDADRESRKEFGGHGNAIAQCYNHMIMPLANSRDKRTQVLWGIQDFEHRFGRTPEGMWLPETAVDLETLDMLAEQGIKFTILSPYQATRIRRLAPLTPKGQASQGADGHDRPNGEKPNAPEEPQWTEAVGGKIDPTRPYLQKLPSGRSITIFFYDGPISQTIAFGDTLDKGENFANRLTGAFNDKRDWAQLVHIATDGETYGHHHKFGDMALAYALEYLKSKGVARITNYGEYLERFPPEWEVQITENTAWSCSHGVARWRENCGCNSGGHAGWNQEWRAPLREALDWLRDQLAPRYEATVRQYLKDPWAARDDYAEVILNRENRDAFLAKHATRELSQEETITVLKLLELQRHALLMYTSCGWFFDELSGIETVQVIQYAARALQLAGDLFEGESLEPQFLDLLARAHSNIPENGDGRKVFDKFVRPAEVDLKRVASHYAVSSLFEAYPEKLRIYDFTVDQHDFRRLESGIVRLLISHSQFTSEITRESADLAFAVLHLGDQNLSGGVREFEGQEQYDEMVQNLSEAFDRADMSDVLRLLDQNFALSFSLESLFKDEQQKAIKLILAPTLADARGAFRSIYERRAPFLRFLGAIHSLIPPELSTAAGFAINSELYRAIHNEPTDIEHFRQLLDEAQRLGVIIDAPGLSLSMGIEIKRQADAFCEDADNLELLEREIQMVDVANIMPFAVQLWHTQNWYWEMLHDVLPDYQARAQQGDEHAVEWVNRFIELGHKLKVSVPDLKPQKPVEEKVAK